MKKMLIACMLMLGCVSCVAPETAVAFAKRAHPECVNHHKISHQYGQVSRTEIGMTCDKVEKSISVKCIHGWGIVSDTTCHQNN